jgi:hypothetical protein
MNDMRRAPELDIVVITGASAGIGRATALEFAKHGARLGLIGDDAGKLDSPEALNGLQAALTRMRARKHGHIVQLGTGDEKELLPRWNRIRTELRRSPVRLSLVRAARWDIPPKPLARWIYRAARTPIHVPKSWVAAGVAALVTGLMLPVIIERWRRN